VDIAGRETPRFFKTISTTCRCIRKQLFTELKNQTLFVGNFGNRPFGIGVSGTYDA
jgi:hypothetical protein